MSDEDGECCIDRIGGEKCQANQLTNKALENGHSLYEAEHGGIRLNEFDVQTIRQTKD